MMKIDAKSPGFWLCLLMAATLILRLASLADYPYHEDESVSIVAMRSIARTGLPLLENGALYWRSLLGHYLMASPLFFLEVSPFSTRLVSVLFSALLLPVVFAMGKELESRPAGWLAALFLAFSAYENLFASMARFYLPFQFFFTAALLFSGAFFLQRRPGSGVWLFLAVAGAIGTHELSLELAPVLLFAAVLGRRSDLLRSPSFLAAAAAVATLLYLNLYFRPPGSFVNYAAIPLKLGAMADKLAFFEWFRKAVPLGTTLLLLGLSPLLGERNRLWVFYFFSFLGLLVALSLVSPDDSPRYFINLLPLGAVLCCASLSWWVRQLTDSGLRRHLFREPSLMRGAPAVLAAAVFLIAGENLDVPSSFGNRVRFQDQGAAHEFIRKRLLPGDTLLSTEPGLTALYLGRPADYFLREDYDPASGSYRPFPPEEKERMPYKILDSPGRLKEILLASKSRVWLYANQKIVSTVSPEADRIIRQNFMPVFSLKQTYVLVRH